MHLICQKSRVSFTEIEVQNILQAKLVWTSAQTFVSSCPNNDIQEKRKKERENSHAENKETWTTMDRKLCNCDGLK